MENKVRTRFAPSPTGRMHVGNLRTALYAYLIAKHEGGDFILRVEDTDQERFVEGALDIIYRTMEKTGLLHDEGPDKDGGFGPYVQSERQASGLYLDYAKQLVEQGDAYYCFCDKERLESLKTSVSDDGTDIVVYDKHCLGLSKEEVEKNLAEGKPWVIRLNVPNEGETIPSFNILSFALLWKNFPLLHYDKIPKKKECCNPLQHSLAHFYIIFFNMNSINYTLIFAFIPSSFSFSCKSG